MNDVTKTEVDMSYVQGFVSLIAQALVAATELPKQIEAMQSDLSTLHSDLDRTKARNIELDTLLGDTRRQRDEAEQNLSQAKSELTQSVSQKDFAEKQATSFQAEAAHIREELAKVKAERDDYGMKQMEAEERAKLAEAKLDKLREAMGIPKEVAKPVESQPDVVISHENLQTGHNYDNPPIPPKRVYEGEYGFNDLSHSTEQWDSHSMRYYRTT